MIYILSDYFYLYADYYIVISGFFKVSLEKISDRITGLTGYLKNKRKDRKRIDRITGLTGY